MSYDRQLDQVCPHGVVEEALFFGTGRDIITPLRPVGTAASMRVRLNGEVMVPPWGSHTPALAKGSKRGPFTVRAGINDTLVVGMDGNHDITLTVPAGNQVREDILVGQLNLAAGKSLFSVGKGRRVRLRGEHVGPDAILVLRASSTLATTLGLPTNRYWRGQTVCPSWSLVRNPNTLSDRPSRFIMFDEALKGNQSYVEISYTTVRQECRRCGGLGVENDWRYGRTGEVTQARDEALLIQESLKAVYTVQGSNVFHTWYGSNIINTIGRKLSSTGLVQNLIVSDIQESFRRWQVVKRKQEEEVGQVVTDAEYPFRLIGITLEQSQVDPTIVYVNVTVQNRLNEPLQIDRGIKLPEPLDILGSTTQQGVYRNTLTSYASASSLQSTTGPALPPGG
jgi:hypothetical protein